MTLLEIKNLSKKFPLKGGFFKRSSAAVHAVTDVSLSIEAGKTLGLVGESGCGKTTLGRLVLKLIESDAGKIIFEEKDLTKISAKQMRKYRPEIQMIFQDPYSSLNPRMTVETILREGLCIQKIGSAQEQKEKISQVLKTVGLSEESRFNYPHQFSGGQRQRIGIARALILKPKLIVCDEPISALDVSIQAQMINLLAELKKEYHLSYLFISHDLKIVRHLSDEIAVMYLGHIVEFFPAANLFEAAHPYTHALLDAIPQPFIQKKQARKLIKAEPPSPISPPSGCVFHTLHI